MSLRSEYSDGELEDWLLDYFKGKPLPKGVDAENNWGVKYFLSPQRGALLNWFDFEPGSRVLEIGAGPGSITEALVKNDIQLTALELSAKRAEINRQRNKQAKNLEIVVGNVEDYRPKEKFDYVVCVGVLEYAGLFMKSHQGAHGRFLKQLATFLNPEGVLLLAIENRLGLKYWAGAREDHTERYFDGINDYPSDFGLKTFGKYELKKLLEGSGFSNQFFYYPHPDYKMPSVIYSERCLPGKNADFPVGILPTPATSNQRVQLFSESLAMQVLEQNELYGEFANSFLVVASQNKTKNFSGQPSMIVQNGRNSAYALQTKVFLGPKSSRVVKNALSAESAEHVHKLGDSYSQLKTTLKGLINVTPTKIDKSKHSAEFPYIDGHSLEMLLLGAIKDDDSKTAVNILDKYFKLVDKLPSIKIEPSKNPGFSKIFGPKHTALADCSKIGLVDVNFDNIIEDKSEKWYLIDYEWVFDFPIPKKYIIGRTLWWFFGLRHSDSFRLMAEKIEMLELAPGIVAPKYLYEKFRDKFESINYALSIEEHFQAYVHKQKLNHVAYWELYPQPKAAKRPMQLLEQYERDIEIVRTHQQVISELRVRLETTQQSLAEINQKYEMITNSRGYKALERARRVKRKVSRKK